MNQLLASIVRAGISPKDLKIEVGQTENTLALPLPIGFYLKNSPFYFSLNYFWGDYIINLFPSSKPAVADNKTLKHFEAVVEVMTEWSKRVGLELMEPDIWSMFGNNVVPQTELFDKKEDQQSFDENELAAVKKSLQEIRHFLVAEMKPDRDRLQAIDEKLAFLEKEATVQNKKQWMYVAVGVAFTIADGLLMSPEQAHKLFAMLSNLFKHLVFRLLP